MKNYHLQGYELCSSSSSASEQDTEPPMPESVCSDELIPPSMFRGEKLIYAIPPPRTVALEPTFMPDLKSRFEINADAKSEIGLQVETEEKQAEEEKQAPELERKPERGADVKTKQRVSLGDAQRRPPPGLYNEINEAMKGVELIRALGGDLEELREAEALYDLLVEFVEDEVRKEDNTDARKKEALDVKVDVQVTAGGDAEIEDLIGEVGDLYMERGKEKEGGVKKDGDSAGSEKGMGRVQRWVQDICVRTRAARLKGEIFVGGAEERDILVGGGEELLCSFCGKEVGNISAQHVLRCGFARKENVKLEEMFRRKKERGEKIEGV